MIVFALLAFQTPQGLAPLPDTVNPEVRRVLEAGFGDPRGGEYRAVKIQVGRVWGHHGEVEARGWVLPGGQKVVCWNGSTYRPISIGAPADYTEDLGKRIVTSAAGLWREGNPTSEEAGLIAKGPAAEALMLILGDTESARRVADSDKRRTLTDVFAWTSFDRALTHLMRSQDEEALEQALIAQKIYPRPSAQQEEFFRNNTLKHPAELLDQLVPDLRRRAKNPVPPFDPLKLKELNEESRIAYLIQQLENVQSNQSGQPGGVSPSSTEIVRALVAQGNSAVDSLLGVLESDERLTRSVYFPRDFMMIRGIVDVKSVAWGATSQIMGVGSVAMKDGKQSVSAIREFWARTKEMTKAERWGSMLADDTAPQNQWSEAIYRITEQNYIRSDGGWVTAPGQAKTLEEARLKGEELRGKLDVTGLMDKRIRQMVASVGRNSSADQFLIAGIGSLAIRRAIWEKENATPLLKFVFDQADDLVLLMRGGASDAVAISMARLADWRIRLGDQSAVKDYEDFLVKFGLPDGWGSDDVLMPLWRHADNPEIDKLARRILKDTKSHWNLRRLMQDRQNGTIVHSLMGSRLYASPAFRDEVLLALKDRTLLYTVRREGAYLVENQKHGRSSSALDLKDPLIPADGDVVPIRRCDFLARAMWLEGIPPFREYWPIAEKDRWIDNVRKQIREEGAAFAKRSRDFDPDPREVG